MRDATDGLVGEKVGTALAERPIPVLGLAPSSWPAKSAFLRVRAWGLMRFSTLFEVQLDAAVLKEDAERLPAL